MKEAETFPRIVGRYALFDAIAAGGMASVHVGRLMGAVGFSRTVAIKRLHEGIAKDPEFIAMFFDEARIVARIRHPNVVPTLDVVALDDELLLVMEYVVGESLWSLLRRSASKGPAPIPIIVEIMVSVLNGLHAAHEATDERGQPLNIVHRDVSPQNILVGADGVARVLDFGIAKAVGRSQQTRTGQVKGKIRYMAPEQIIGNGVDRAADIYAAAIVLWESLAGERLFHGDNDAQIMYRIVEGQVRPLRPARPDVSPRLEAIIMQALRRDPRTRQATAKEMADALEAEVQPVKRSVVADWVAENANESIGRQKARIAAIEAEGTPSYPHHRPPISFSLQGPPGGQPQESSRITSAASLSQSLPPVTPVLSPRRHLRMIGIAGGILLTSIAVLLFVQWKRTAIAQVTDAQAAGSVMGSTEMPMAAAPSSGAPSPVDPPAPAEAHVAPAPTISGEHVIEKPPHQRAAPRKSPATKAQPVDRIYKRD